MTAPKWEDVEVGDGVLLETDGDVMIHGTVTDTDTTAGFYLGRNYISPSRWTLLDIIKPEPQLPTTVGSIVSILGAWILEPDMLWHSLSCRPCWFRNPEGESLVGLSARDWTLVYDAGKK